MYLGIIIHLRDNFYYVFWTAISIFLVVVIYIVIRLSMKHGIKDAVEEISTNKELDKYKKSAQSYCNSLMLGWNRHESCKHRDKCIKKFHDKHLPFYPDGMCSFCDDYKAKDDLKGGTE